MNNWTIDIENKDRKYLNEKELFILYWLLKIKHISTRWSNVFTLDYRHIPISEPVDLNSIENREEYINNAIEQEIKRIQGRMRSPVVVRYLLETGKLLDIDNFSLYGDANYSLTEGGFLCKYIGNTMREYIKDSPENRKDNSKYWELTAKCKDFLEKVILGEESISSDEYDKFAYPFIEEYENAIIEKNADDDFIELVNKTAHAFDGDTWNTEDVKKFLDIYYKHNKQELHKNVLDKKSFLYEDSQTKLSGLFFENAHFGISIEKTEKLQKYINEYTQSFIKNELSGLSKQGLTGTFFREGLSAPLNTQYFGYTKQKEILIKYIEEKYEEYQRDDLEIGHPYLEPEYIGDNKFYITKINISNKNKDQTLFLFVHTMIALEAEGYLTIEKFSYGPELLDLYDKGFLFKIRLNKQTNQRIEYDRTYRKLTVSGQEIDLSVSAKETDSILLIESLLDAENDEWKHNDEILSDWNYLKEDIKVIPKNKVYFAAKNINEKVAIKTEIKDFIEYSTTKARINPKYKKLINNL